MGEDHGIMGKRPHQQSPHHPPKPLGTHKHFSSTPGSTGKGDWAAVQAMGAKAITIQGGDLAIHVPPVSFGRRDRNSPVLVPPESVADFLTVKATEIPMGGPWGSITAGSNWRLAEGDRFVLLPSGYDVLYVQGGKYYIQKKEGFIGDVNNWYKQVADRCASRFVQRVFTTELKLLLGIIAGASGVGFVVVVGSEVLEFVIEHRDDFGPWIDAVLAFKDFQATMRGCAPDLYEHLSDDVYRKSKQEWWAQLEGAAKTPETISFFIGVVWGHVIGHLKDGHPLTPLFICWTLFKATVARSGIDVGPDAAKAAARHMEEEAKEFIELARTDGVTLAGKDVQKLQEEIRKNRDCIVPALKALTAVLAPLQNTFQKAD